MKTGLHLNFVRTPDKIYHIFLNFNDWNYRGIITTSFDDFSLDFGIKLFLNF